MAHHKKHKRKKHPDVGIHTPEEITSPGHQGDVHNPSIGPLPAGSRLIVSPSLGYVTFVSYSDNTAADGLEFTALLGDGSPTPKGGYGGWQPTSRQRRRAMTEWQGVDPLTIEIAILFDAFDIQASVERDIRQLEKMAGLSADINEPPLILFDSGGVVPHDATNAGQTDWVISDIQWGDADRNTYGHRVRQAATLTMMQFVDDDSLTAATSAQRRRRRRKRTKERNTARRRSHAKRYVVKGANETLETIAAHQLHASSRWREIKNLNPKYRDPKKILPIGTVLRLP